ncbi:cation:proton antiporter [Paraburkholderia sp. MMS20-SJTR3]|uniref:Cation:proton antiporter n=1 Tax=Paraburkholderia sejongensis TaxID=2886946 RepID=A0ABS8K022_9BURK|nr:cation:proton antiporter [Paraburkholderia sp. MMS20-SJTR3]MCC8395512.1 cation:proton antiporter [Paraburkholderia sp. MMS20-SJTR3]
MRDEPLWFLLIGALLTFMAVARGPIRRLPLTGAMIYLAVGVAMGPGVTGLVGVDLLGNTVLLAIIAEVGLVVSLFSIGMHLRVRLNNPLWWLPLRLGGPAMLVTVAMMFGFTAWLNGHASGAALFLAATLAPTDPVLANELRVKQAGDDEPVRFALSGEGGMNDGAAYPFAVLGLTMAGAQLYGSSSGAHFAGSVAWGIVSAPVIGGVLAIVFARAILFLRTRYGEAIGLDGFLALGLMATSYGAALLLHAYAFIAVFVAGVALRHEELRATGDRNPAEVLEDVPRGERVEVAKDPQKAHAYLAESMMGFTLEMERIGELSLMLIIGCVVSAHWRDMLDVRAVLPALFLFFVARPLSVFVAMGGARIDRGQRQLMAWMGIRGVGAFYYLMFGLEFARDAIAPLLPAVLDAIVLSVLLHGSSANYVLGRYFAGRR